MKKTIAISGILTVVWAAMPVQGQTQSNSSGGDPALYNGSRPGFFIGPTYLPGYFSMPNFYLGTLYGPVQGFGSYHGPASYLGNSFNNPGYVPAFNSIPDMGDTTQFLFRTDQINLKTSDGEAPPSVQVLNLAAADSSPKKSAGASADTAKPEKARILFNVKVPADAELWFEGQKTSQKGTRRKFQTPPVDPGRTYTYQIRARWTDAGKEIDRPQKFKVKAGDVLNIDFTLPESQKAEPPAKSPSEKSAK